jgi:hypothetical protein
MAGREFEQGVNKRHSITVEETEGEVSESFDFIV